MQVVETKIIRYFMVKFREVNFSTLCNVFNDRDAQRLDIFFLNFHFIHRNEILLYKSLQIKF